MLELHEAEGAFAQLEQWLADELSEGESADVFLGYGLSGILRRTTVPAPPEPCPLPLLAARPTACANLAQAGFTVGEWQPSWSSDAYANAIESVRAAIARGDVYQVNLVQHLAAPFAGDPAGLAAALSCSALCIHGRWLRRVGDRLGVTRAVSLSSRRSVADDADQRDAAGGRGHRRREGLGRAHDDRRSGAQRPLARLR